MLDDGPARPAVALVAAGHLPREVRRREVHELDAARVRPQPVVAPDALAPVDAFAVSRERVYELDGLKLLDLEDATVEIAVRIGLNYGEPEAPIRDSEVSVYYLSNLNNSEPLRLGIAPR